YCGRNNPIGVTLGTEVEVRLMTTSRYDSDGFSCTASLHTEPLAPGTKSVDFTQYIHFEMMKAACLFLVCVCVQAAIDKENFTEKKKYIGPHGDGLIQPTTAIHEHSYINERHRRMSPPETDEDHALCKYMYIDYDRCKEEEVKTNAQISV
ncbi:unnamed protein product, partial [Meganyctiphanes norvegica]